MKARRKDRTVYFGPRSFLEMLRLESKDAFINILYLLKIKK